MATRLSIVSIDDDAVDSEHLRRNLEAIREWSVDFRSFTDPMVGVTDAVRRPPDILFLDVLMEPHSGLELLRTARSLGYDRPVICLTGLEKTETVVECLRSGAADYLPKESLDPTVLKGAISRAIREHRVETARFSHMRDLETTNHTLHRKNDRIREFYRQLSVELSGPLTTVHKLTSLLLEELPAGCEQGPGSYVHFIRESVDDVVHLLEDLRDATEERSGRMRMIKESVSPGWMLRQVVAALLPSAEREGVAIELFVERELPDVRVDRLRMERTLSNLLRMAVRYTPSGEEVRLRGRSSSDRTQLELLVEIPGRNPYLDRLIGEPAIADADPVDTPDLGPSLRLCAEVAALHGGSLEGESNGTEGGHFRLVLPLEDEHETAADSVLVEARGEGEPEPSLPGIA